MSMEQDLVSKPAPLSPANPLDKDPHTSRCRKIQYSIQNSKKHLLCIVDQRHLGLRFLEESQTHATLLYFLVELWIASQGSIQHILHHIITEKPGVMSSSGQILQKNILWKILCKNRIPIIGDLMQEVGSRLPRVLHFHTGKPSAPWPRSLKVRR